jgi:hypothetical protein
MRIQLSGGIMPTESAKNSDRSPQREPERKWWRRPITWILSLVSALILAMVVAFGTGLGNTLLVLMKGHGGDITGPALEINVYHETHDDASALGITAFPNKIALTPRELQQLSKEGSTRWLARRGGYDVGTGIKLTLTARRPVRILQMRAVVLARTKPIAGTIFFPAAQGSIGLTKILFSLDNTSSVALDMNKYPPPPYFANHAVVLKRGEQDTFAIFAVTKHWAVRWVINITYLDGNRVKHVTIDDSDKRPFETTARRGQTAGYQAVYQECYTGTVLAKCAGKPIGTWVRSK